MSKSRSGKVLLESRRTQAVQQAQDLGAVVRAVVGHVHQRLLGRIRAHGRCERELENFTHLSRNSQSSVDGAVNCVEDEPVTVPIEITEPFEGLIHSPLKSDAADKFKLMVPPAGR